MLGSNSHFLILFLNDVALINVHFLNYVSGFSNVAVVSYMHLFSLGKEDCNGREDGSSSSR